MADVAVSFSFSPNTTAASAQVTTNFSDITTWLNLRNAGSATWDNVYISATASNPLNIISSGAATELSIDNTATTGDSFISFRLSASTIFSMGVDDSDGDGFKIARSSALGTTDHFTINSSGEIGLGPTAVSAASAALNIEQSLSGSNILLRLVNNASNAASGAQVLAGVADGASGDPFYRCSIGSGIQWALGTDNSDSDTFKISQNATLGTNDFFIITTAGQVQLGSGSSAVNVRLNTSSGTGASTATMTNSPTVGNPVAWINVNVNGTDRKIPVWA